MKTENWTEYCPEGSRTTSLEDFLVVVLLLCFGKKKIPFRFLAPFFAFFNHKCGKIGPSYLFEKMENYLFGPGMLKGDSVCSFAAPVYLL